MRQSDLFILGGGIVAVGLAIWGLWAVPSIVHRKRMSCRN